MKPILFNSKQEANFSCPLSQLEPFTAFLKNENIKILNSKKFGEQSGEEIYMIEVSENLDAAESKRLISKFVTELTGKS